MIPKFLRFLAPTPPLAQSTPAEQIAQARSLVQQGRRDAAAALYGEILGAHPDSPDAHYGYANVLKDQGNLAAALRGYDRAIALRPDHPHAHCNRAVVLGLMGRFPEALAGYDRAIAIDPSDVIALCNRGVLQNGLGDKDAALASFDGAIAQDANCFTAHFGRGALLQERKAWAESLAAYDRAIAVNPSDALAHYNRGTVLKELKQWNAALTSYGRAIASNAQFHLAHAKRAEVLQELNQLAAALESYDRAVALQAADPTMHNDRAVLLHSMGRFEAALAGYDRAVAAKPDYAEAWFNRGTVLKDLADLDGALGSYGRAISARPRYAAAILNRGVTLQEMGRVNEAIASYQQALDIAPELPEAHYNLALASLTVGDFATGWTAYEWRWRAKGGPIYREKRDFDAPLWIGGDDVAGKTLLLYGEQGLGDSLQFCRYVERVVKLGPRVVLEVPPPLVDLCARLAGVAQVVPYGSPLPEFDRQCPLMSLPLAFETRLETIPSPAGYLVSDAAKVVAWQNRLGETRKPRIGLAWSGNQTAGTNRKRHFPLATLIPHLSQEFDYFCLQTDVVQADQDTLARTPWISQFQGALRNFDDTAALCDCLDLIITVDTSVAHLNGALGNTTWVMLPFVADWRWMMHREDSPWYRTARLFRQESPGDWSGVFARVAAALALEF